MTVDFEALVRAHQDAVCATAYAVLRDRARSEEIAQDAFLIAWRKLPSMATPPVLPGWICGIARNLARNAARKWREVPMPASHDHEAAVSAHQTAPMTPLDAALSREQIEIAERALATLSESDREIVVMYYRGDESMEHVASALGVTATTARQKLHRSRTRLREALTSVEATLRATRPTTAFTVACVAALARGVAPAEAAAASRVPLAIGASVGLAVIVTAVGVGYSWSQPSPDEGAPTPEIRTTTSSTTSARSGWESSRTSVVERISVEQRQAAITRARSSIAASLRSAHAGEEAPMIYDFADVSLEDIRVPDPLPTGVLTKATIRYAIALVQPMILECGPPEAGRLAIRMRLVGDGENPTVVETVDVLGDSPLADHPAFVECVRDTLLLVDMPPTDRSRVIELHAPFVVR